jgi:hypothetical protein
MEKMKLPPSGPISSQSAQSAADGKISRHIKTTGTRTVKGTLQTPPHPKKRIETLRIVLASKANLVSPRWFGQKNITL